MITTTKTPQDIKAENLIETATKLLLSHVSNEGKLDFSEKEYDWLSQAIEEAEIGFLKQSPESDYSVELFESNFTTTAEQVIINLEHRIKSVTEELPSETDDNSAQNNRLIAGFLGASENSGGEFEMYGIIEGIDDDLYTEHFYFAKEMKFSSSWDWIMQAVLKIEENNIVEIRSESVTIFTNDGEKIVDFQPSDFIRKIEAVNKAVIEFINWYNDNAQK